MDIRTLKIGEVIITENDPSKNMYFLISGKLAVMAGGKRINTIMPDEVFGELAFVMDIPRTATVYAEETSTIVSFCPGNLNEELDNMPEWVKKFVLGLMQKIVNLTEIIAKK